MTPTESLPEVNTVGKLPFLLSSTHSSYHSNVETDALRAVMVIKPAGRALGWDCLGSDLSTLVPLQISVTNVPNRTT